MSGVGQVLILDDDPDVLKAARIALLGDVAAVETLGSSEGLEDAVAPGGYDVALLDMNFTPGDHTGREGLSALARIRAADPALAVVLMTSWGGVALAVEALKQGAADFVLKPWRNDKLAAAVAAAAEATRARRQFLADENLETAEKAAIERALRRHGGNISHAAAALGLTRPALYRRMAKHGL